MKLTIANRYIVHLFICLCLFFSMEAIASQRSVCFDLRFADVRDFCPQNGAAGVRRGCNDPGGFNSAVGHYVALYDKDWGDPDDFIGVYYTRRSGNVCINFEWENASYSQGEADPDLYITYIYAATSTDLNQPVWAQMKETNGNFFGSVSWRNGIPGNPDRFVAMNCSTGINCQLNGSGYLYPSSDPTSVTALATMGVDTIQHTLQAFGGAFSKNIKIHFPAKPACPYSCTVSQTEIHIATSLIAYGTNPAHEMGHAMQMQQFGQDSLRDNCSLNGAGHDMETIEYDSCATTEGWSNYVAVTSWYDPDNVSTVPWLWGYNMDQASPVFVNSCVNSGHTELQVAKGFWDMDDANNEASVSPGRNNDSTNVSSLSIAKGWGIFANGTANGQSFENGVNGVNIWDYFFNNNSIQSFPGTWADALIYHNCLSSHVI